MGSLAPVPSEFVTLRPRVTCPFVDPVQLTDMQISTDND